MTEYRVRKIRDGEGTDALERTCNTLAKEGWRLVSTSATTDRPGESYVWLFFERTRDG